MSSQQIPPEIDDDVVEMLFKASFEYLDKKGIYYDNGPKSYKQFDAWATKFIVDVHNAERQAMLEEQDGPKKSEKNK
jgi:hypothetical protein